MSTVVVDVATKSVLVEASAPESAVRAAIAGAGYDVERSRDATLTVRSRSRTTRALPSRTCPSIGAQDSLRDVRERKAGWALSGSDGPAEPGAERLELDEAPGVRRRDLHPSTDVEGDVVGTAGALENEVTRLKLAG